MCVCVCEGEASMYVLEHMEVCNGSERGVGGIEHFIAVYSMIMYSDLYTVCPSMGSLSVLLCTCYSISKEYS